VQIHDTNIRITLSGDHHYSHDAYCLLSSVALPPKADGKWLSIGKEVVCDRPAIKFKCKSHCICINYTA